MDTNRYSSSASTWIRRLLTATAATLIGLAATPDLALAKEGEVLVGLSDGGGFADAGKSRISSFCLNSEACAVGDVNGDGRADLIAFQHGRPGTPKTGVYFSLSEVSIDASTGAQRVRFGPREKWNDYSFCVDGEACAVGAADGDGRADIIAFQHRGPGGAETGVYVSLSEVWLRDRTGKPLAFRFGATQKSNDYFCVDGEECAVGYVNDDGRADIIAFQHGWTGTGVSVGLSEVWLRDRGRVAKLVEIGRRGSEGMVWLIRRRGQGRRVSGRGWASHRPGAW
jgi:hypothetical protein